MKMYLILPKNRYWIKEESVTSMKMYLILARNRCKVGDSELYENVPDTPQEQM